MNGEKKSLQVCFRDWVPVTTKRLIRWATQLVKYLCWGYSNIEDIKCWWIWVKFYFDEKMYMVSNNTNTQLYSPPPPFQYYLPSMPHIPASQIHSRKVQNVGENLLQVYKQHVCNLCCVCMCVNTTEGTEICHSPSHSGPP